MINRKKITKKGEIEREAKKQGMKIKDSSGKGGKKKE